MMGVSDGHHHGQPWPPYIYYFIDRRPQISADRRHQGIPSTWFFFITLQTADSRQLQLHFRPRLLVFPGLFSLHTT